MRTVRSREGLVMPVMGLGTWTLGEDASRRVEEVNAIRMGLDLGMNLIDTAEMYADGGAETVVGEAIRGRRDKVVLVSKVLPVNASGKGTIAAAERSLKRLGTDHLDLYLLHWPSEHPWEETAEAMRELQRRGDIRHFGVSNFDRGQMESAEDVPGGIGVSNQVVYNLNRRGIEAEVLPWCREREVTVMAYSPLDQGRLQPGPALQAVADAHGVTPEEAALAWTIREPGVITIPKSTNPDHLRANLRAARLTLTEEDLAALDEEYPPPSGSPPLETL